MSACWRFPDEASIVVWAYQPSLHDFRFERYSIGDAESAAMSGIGGTRSRIPTLKTTACRDLRTKVFLKLAQMLFEF